MAHPKNSEFIQAEDLKSHVPVPLLCEQKRHPNLFDARIKSELNLISVFSQISSSSKPGWGNYMRIQYYFLTSLVYFPNLIEEFSTPWIYILPAQSWEEKLQNRDEWQGEGQEFRVSGSVHLSLELGTNPMWFTFSVHIFSLHKSAANAAVDFSSISIESSVTVV